MPREPPVMSAALPAREIIEPPRNRKSKVESRPTCPRRSSLQSEERFLPKSRNPQAPGSAGQALGRSRGLPRNAAGIARCGNEFAEQALGKRIAKHAFGMPLDAHDPIGIAGPFDAFDRAVGRARSDAQILARRRDGLVMRAVDGGLGAPCDGSQTAA